MGTKEEVMWYQRKSTAGKANSKMEGERRRAEFTSEVSDDPTGKERTHRH